MNIIFSSCGDDSAAVIAHCFKLGLEPIHVAYSDTHWGSEEWPDRVEMVKRYVEQGGGTFHTIGSIGFEELCRRKRAIPTNGMAFCSYELKIKPAMEWLETIDPNKEATCITGVRREESVKRRDWPEWINESENHGGRELWSPLVRHTKAQRDELLREAGFEPLGHRSSECFPCVNAGKMDLRMLGQREVDRIAALEDEIGAMAKNGGERYMFRRGHVAGAAGIVEVMKWASHTKYIEGQDDLFGGDCDSGFCGD